MSDFKTHLQEERSQLNERIDKLEAFRRSDKFSGIASVQQSLLNAQVHVMLAYSQILDERIEWLVKTSVDPISA